MLYLIHNLLEDILVATRLQLFPEAAFLLLEQLNDPLYPLIMELLKMRVLELFAVADPVILPTREGA